MDWWKKHKELGEFLALTIAWPALIYLATLDWNEYAGHTDHSGVVVLLAVTGMITWVIRNH